jgi:hypothetical protein
MGCIVNEPGKIQMPTLDKCRRRVWQSKSLSLSVPQPAEWQHIGNQINAAFVFARSDFVKVHFS